LLAVLAALPFLGSYLPAVRQSPVIKRLDDELVLVRGWILKRSDLPDDFFT
jgi:hypothetical protein